MKNEILDNTPKSIFQDQLRSNEKVIWKGQPSPNWLSIIFQFVWIILLYGIFFLINTRYQQDPFLYISFGLLVILIVFIQAYTKISNHKYLISNQKVHFKFEENNQAIFLAIPFQKIDSIHIERSAVNFNFGDITLYADVDIKYDLKQLQLSRKSSPTFESISQVKDIEKYLNLGIQGKL